MRALKSVATPFLSKADEERVVAAIREAETKSTGEIAVHIVGHSDAPDLVKKAEALFHELGLHKTKDRNGVLILVCELDHTFAIWGDEGIHTKAGQELWDKATKDMHDQFKAGRHGDGLVAAVSEVGARLTALFPRTGDGPDTNELPDTITRS